MQDQSAQARVTLAEVNQLTESELNEGLRALRNAVDWYSDVSRWDAPENGELKEREALLD